MKKEETIQSQRFLSCSLQRKMKLFWKAYLNLLVDIRKSDSFAKHQLYKNLCVGILRSSWKGNKVHKLVSHRFSVVLNIHKKHLINILFSYKSLNLVKKNVQLENKTKIPMLQGVLLTHSGDNWNCRHSQKKISSFLKLQFAILNYASHAC